MEEKYRKEEEECKQQLLAGNGAQFGTGCMKSPYDERNYQFAALCASVDHTEYPSEYEPEYEPRFFDQGSSSMCCACACAMSRYIYELKDSGNKSLLSPTYIYGNRGESNVVDGIYTGEGMYLKDALSQLKRYGTCYNLSMEGFFGNYDQCHDRYEANHEKLDEEAHPFRTSSYYEVKTVKEVKKAILLTGSVLAAYTITKGWYYPGAGSGMIHNFGDIEGGHAVLIVGWKTVLGKECWIIHNSWGNKWGKNGFAYIPQTEEFMEAYCILDDVKEIQIKEEATVIKSEMASDYNPND